MTQRTEEPEEEVVSYFPGQWSYYWLPCRSIPAFVTKKSVRLWEWEAELFLVDHCGAGELKPFTFLLLDS